MAVEISQDAIKKLMHDSEEIRMRALDQIESKFMRASAHQLKIEFKPAELCKELIRLFKHHPRPGSSVRILQLLKRLLGSDYGVEVLKIISPDCLKSELYNLRESVTGVPCKIRVVNEIDQILSYRENCSNDFDQSNSSVLSLQNNLSINIREESITPIPNFEMEDYEVGWSNPSSSEYNALKVISDVLTDHNTTSEEKQDVLFHLQNTMKDYAAEYMLQSPHLFSKMLQLHPKSQRHKNDLSSTVSATLLLYIKALRERLIKRYKVDSYSAQEMGAPSKSQEQKSNFFIKQLKVRKAMELLLAKCFEDLEVEISSIREEIISTMEIFTEIFKIVKILNLSIKSRFLKQADQIRTKLQNIYSQEECSDTNVISIARTKYIWLTFILVEMAEINTKFSHLKNHYKLITPQLIDFALQMHYPNLFSRIKNFVFEADATVKESYQQMQNLRSQFETVIQILTKEFNNTSMIICQAVKILPILDVVNSVTLIKILFHSICNAIPSILSDDNLKYQALLLLRSLTALKSVNLKSFVFKNIAKSVKSHFAALMNNEIIFNGVQNHQLLSASILGIPMDKHVLQHIIYTNLESNCPEVRNSAEDIIVLQIKSYHFYESSLEKYLEIVSPLLQMLQCCTHSMPICDTLFKLLEPDSKQFPFIDKLRCNIGFLFVNNISIRNEALTRLIFILNSVPETLGYLPNIQEICDLLPNDLCIMQNPRDLGFKSFSNKSYYDSDALLNLLKILASSNIEPQLRKATLLQLNIMCNNWDCVAVLCEEQAHYHVLFALENSLKKYTSLDYIENVIPTISILAKLLIYDKTFRQELEHIPNVYILLLLALFHFWQDVQLRQDASICLFLLVFGNIMTMPSGCGYIEAPKMLSNMNVPFKCKFKTFSADECFSLNIISNNPQGFITSEAIWRKYLRQVIAYSYFKSSKFSKNELEKMRINLDISRSFLLEQREAELMRATNYIHNISFIMKRIDNATDQKIVLLSIATMHIQLMIYRFEFTSLTELPLELANDFFIILNKYLQVSPGNTADLQIYSCALKIFHLCVRFSLLPVTKNLINMLKKDYFHCIIITLGNSELPLDVFLQLNEFHVALLEASNEKCAENQIFKANLFEFLHNKILHFYAIRNLQRIRGLLKISKYLTSTHLGLPDRVLYKCSKTFIKLSINVTTSTHTFAQWHHDCLVNFIQISVQLTDVIKTRLPNNFYNHMVGLCGHSNMEVRALSWTCFSLLAKSGLTGIKNNHIPGTHLLASKLSHLPGGFISCCFNTFLDDQEVLLVRNLVGNLFVLFLKDPFYFEKASQFLEKKAFVNTVYLSLKTYMLDNNFRISNSFLKTMSEFTENCADINIMTSETVICFSRIYVVLLTLRPKFLKEFGEHPLLLKFFELLKLPITTNNKFRYEMCAEICHICVLCSRIDFLFLKRSVCHDDRWLTHLFDLLEPPLNVTERAIVCVIQLILTLSRDEYVFHRLVESLANRLDVLSKLFCRAISVANIGSALQRCTLELILHLLIKSQFVKEKYSFIIALEKEFYLSKWSLQTLFHCKPNNKHFNKTKKTEIRNDTSERKISLSEIIIEELFTVFVHLYSSNSFKFHEPIGVTRIQVCEVLSLLLKLSSHARQKACNLNLLKKVLLILEKFFDQSENNSTILRRRYVENKKESIIDNFKLLFQILLHWYSPSADVLTDDLQCFEISKVILESWIWLQYSLELKELVLKLCSFLSEKSFSFCVQFSTRSSSHSQSILELVFMVVEIETHRVRTNNDTHLAIVEVGLRVMINCCACTEGRCVLVKLHVLDTIEKFNPFNIKSSKLNQNVLHFWLQFYELFSRYNEGGEARNLKNLCIVINRFTPSSKMRLTCLKILRNMCFVQRNRTVFYSSPDFIFTVKEIITWPLINDMSDPTSYEEKIIMSVCIWQLISGGIKFVAMIRGTKLENSIRELHEKLLIFKEEDPTNFKKQPFAFNLSDILKIIVNIFDHN